MSSASNSRNELINTWEGIARNALSISSRYRSDRGEAIPALVLLLNLSSILLRIEPLTHWIATVLLVLVLIVILVQDRAFFFKWTPLQI